MTAMEEVTVRLNPDEARLYREAKEMQRRKFDVLMSLGLRGWEHDSRSLSELARDYGREAEANGLTQDILDAILADEA